jgi:hypothetical protein
MSILTSSFVNEETIKTVECYWKYTQKKNKIYKKALRRERKSEHKRDREHEKLAKRAKIYKIFPDYYTIPDDRLSRSSRL